MLARQELAEKYAKLSDNALHEIRDSDTLSDVAYEVAEAELKRRSLITIESELKIPHISMQKNIKLLKIL